MRRALLLPCLFACLALSGCKADPAIRLHVSGLDADISALRARVSLDGAVSQPVKIFNRLAPGGEDLFGPGGQALLGLQLPTAARGEALISLEGITPYRLVVSSGAALPAPIDAPSTIDVDLRLDRQRSCNHSGSATWCREGPGPLGLPNIDHIHGSASDDVWAVGYSGLILHWDGVAWQDLSYATSLDLYAVWALTRDDAWAVGNGSTVLRWDGKMWSQALSQERFPKYLWYSIWAAAANDVWIAGSVPGAAEGLLLRWNGKDFTPYTIAGSLPNRLFGLSPSDIWTVGAASGQEATAHWDGTRWTPVPVQAPSATVLQSVWGSGPADLWALGSGGVLHWDGTVWKRVILADQVQGISPQGIWGTGKDDVWLASGRYVRHWDGRKWQPVTLNERSGDSSTTTWTSPDGEVWVGGTNATLWRQEAGSFQRHVGGAEERIGRDLNAVWGSGAADVWAAGSTGSVLRYNGARWSAVPSGTDANLRALWGSGPGDFWIVGDRGTMLHRQGDAFALTEHGGGETLLAAHGTGADDVWVVGSPGVVLHFDGAAWSTAGPGDEATTNFRGVYAHSRDTLTIVGETMTTLKARVRRWTRAGGWTDLSPDHKGDLLRSVYGPSAGQLFVVTSNPGRKLLRYQGSVWLPPIDLNSECTQIFGGRSDGPWISCQEGPDMVQRWEAQQQRLVQERPLAWGRYNGLWGTDGGDLWAVGDFGAIARRLGR